ncbi:MAG: aldehyde dehydrogenase family protein [Planctomycetia bacterium]|nr:aldehyde dehydrogenase family protein [Planctomycetia bacterium]
MDTKEMIGDLVAKARVAQAELDNFTQDQVDQLARAIGKVVFDNAEEFARLAVDETKMGVYEDKVMKCRGKARIIWNSLKGKKSVGIIERNPETGITLIARPVGVIGAIAPCTNPVVTPMSNAMFAIKGRNTIIIAPHPRAKKCNKIVVEKMIEAISKLGAPKNTIQYIEESSSDISGELMKAVDIVVATGGMGMVRAAYSSGKPAFGVGAGNVQCILDENVDLADAAKKIVAGRKFDNGIICSAEQTVIAPRKDYDRVIEELKKNGCAFFNDAETKKKFREALFPGGIMNKAMVGQNAMKVAELAGVSVPEGTKVILIEADAPGKGDLFSKEKMCPVISTYPYDSWEEALKIAQDNLNVEGRGHSVSIHSNDQKHIEMAAEHLTVSRVLINQICSTQNGGSFTNNLTPTTTLGCGSWGNNSISENFYYKHLLNITRIGYEIKGYNPSDEEIWG